MLRELVFVASTFCLLNGVFGYSLTVETESGTLQGTTVTSDYNSLSYYAFKGVPYAEPPVGSLRFQDPQTKTAWSGVLDASQEGSPCAAPEPWDVSNPIYGSEDCLFLNIYVPKTDSDNSVLSLPVMVWFHGGGFLMGHSGLAQGFDPSYLVEQNVIVVTLNYRLGVLGFLTSLDDNARGNAGLKDQAFALKWVQNNIANFGGDPSKVTIFGESAGGASVEYQLVSPLSAGLFSQAIVQSGSTLNEWAFQYDPLTLTKNLATTLGVSTSDTASMIAGLQAVDYSSLIRASYQISGGNFLPHIETSSNSFLPKSSYEIWMNHEFNKVPILIGYNNEDGSYGYGGRTQFQSYPHNLIPNGLNIDKYGANSDTIVELITQQYFPDGDYSNLGEVLKFMTQHYFARGIRKTVEAAVGAGVPVYFYEFEYVGSYTSGYNGGVAHGEELQYIWHEGTFSAESDILTSKRMVSMWTNFVKNGNPTPDTSLGVTWKEASDGVSGDSVNYLLISNDLVPGTNPDQSDYEFWNNIWSTYGQGTPETY